MRPNKKIWLALGIVIFAIAALFLYLRSSGELGKQENLRSNLSTTQSTVARLIREESTLQSQLADVKSQLVQATSARDATKSSFPESTQSIEYDQVFFSLADASNLMVTSLATAEPRPQKEGPTKEAITYLSASFVVDVEGRLPGVIFTTSQGHKDYIYLTVSNILDLVNKLASGTDFTFATMKLVNITVPEPLTEIDLDNWRRETKASLDREFLSDEAIEGMSEEAIATLESEIALLVEKRLPAEIKAVLKGMSEATLEGMSWGSPSLPEEMVWRTKLRVAKASATIEVSLFTLPR